MPTNAFSLQPEEFGSSRLVLSILVALCLVANGCATRAGNLLRPPAVAASEATPVDLLVATTRKPSKVPGQLYSGERGTAISLDSVTVTIPPDRNRRIGKIQRPSRLPPDPAREFAMVGVDKVATERELFDWFRKNRNAERQVLIFVHGYNNSYTDAVFRLSQIVHDAGTDAAPILFAWPSRAKVFGYLYDKDSAHYSRRALEDLIIQASLRVPT